MTTLGVIIFLVAVTLVLAFAYRTGFNVGRTDVGTAAAFGFNVGVAWAFSLVVLGIFTWGMGSFVPLMLGGVVVVAVSTQLGAWPALVRRGDDGLTRHERKRMAREHRSAMMAPFSDDEKRALQRAENDLSS